MVQVPKCPKLSLGLKKEMQAFLDVGKEQKVVTRKKKEAKYEACREDVFWLREELSSNDDGDSERERERE